MQLHVPPPQLHFRPVRPPRSKPAPARRSDLLPISLFNAHDPALAGFRRAPFGGLVRTRLHTRIPCSTSLLLRLASQASIRAFSSRLNILIPVISHSPRTYSALGLPFPFSNSSTLRSQGYPQVLFEPHLNSHAQACVCMRDDSQTRPHPAPHIPAFTIPLFTISYFPFSYFLFPILFSPSNSESFRRHSSGTGIV
jgi:hypothetical protein